MTMNFTKIDGIKKEIDALPPLAVDEIRRLRESEFVEEIFHSNALEGNRISKQETSMVLFNDFVIANKSLREHIEIINLAEAISFSRELASANTPITENVIKEVHKILMTKILKDRSMIGTYRNVPVMIMGSDHKPPQPHLLVAKMQNLIAWSEENKKQLHPVEYAALLHEKFVTIHPFVDGNGRTARILMNMALLECGFPIIIIESDPETRNIYNKALEHAQTKKDTKPFINFIIEIMEKRLEKDLYIVDMANKMKTGYYDNKDHL